MTRQNYFLTANQTMDGQRHSGETSLEHQRPMSAWGQKRTWQRILKADIG
jgi:hypothetical protein